jgi:hypothetical protein
VPSDSGSSDPAARPAASSAAAADTLRDLAGIRARSRRAATRDLLRLPLVFWGLAWIAGFSLLDLAPWSVAVPVGAALAVAAAAATWLSRARPAVRSGWEHRTRAGWIALLACSPFLVLSISPVPARVMAVFLGALWGVALVLYAIATGDVPLGVAGGLTVAAAGFCRVLLHHNGLLGFGLCAGSAMLALGGWRLRTSALRPDRLPSGL